MPSTFNIPPFGALVAIYGNSLTARLLTGGVMSPYQMQAPVIQATRLAGLGGTTARVENRLGRGHAPVGTPTVFVNYAVDGATINGINAIIDGTFANNPFTHVIIDEGTNERTRTRGQTQADITAQAAKFGTLPVLLTGPYAWGELQPGPNVIAGANDTRLNETNIDLGTIFPAIHPNVVYIDLRTTAWASIPPPGANSGIRTVDGAHYNLDGRYDIGVNYILPHITFNP